MANPSSGFSLEDKDFFVLLQAGLGSPISGSLSIRPDWAYIYRLSVEQAVTGIVADGLFRLLSENKRFEISIEWKNKFLETVPSLVRANYDLLAVQDEVCQLLLDNDVRFVVVKGQIIAQCYPNPMLRSCGDIDLLLDDSNYEKAKYLLSQKSDIPPIEDVNQKHLECFIEGTVVELHADEFGVTSRLLKKVYKRYKDEMLHSRNIEVLELRNQPIPVPSVSWHVSYIFVHLYKHYISSGIGIRQVIDLYMFLLRYQYSISVKDLDEYLGRFGVVPAWNSFCQFIMETLSDARIAQFLFGKDRDFSIDEIWQQIKESGNLGQTRKDRILVKSKTKPFLFFYPFLSEYRKFCARRRISKSYAYEQFFIFIHSIAYKLKKFFFK